MTNEIFARTIRLIGQENFDKLQKSKVAIFGLGGVGGHAANALCRAGVGEFFLVDGDVVDVSNLNRQMVARISTIDKNKVDVMKNDMLDINPHVKINTEKIFLTEDNLLEHFDLGVDFVLDCIDTVSCKLQIAKICYNNNIPIISSTGAGNRTEAEFVVTDIYSTKDDPLAKVLRRELKFLGVKKLPVVWSKTLPIKLHDGLRTPASISFIPPAAGLKMAEYVVNTIINKN